MASSSTSFLQKSFKYDVFLSFRGKDTRHNFVSHLYRALEKQGILTYKDDEKIEKGATIDTQLIESIEESRFFIIVFSKDYTGSSWCLDELVKIMECQKTSKQTVYPVFYDVEPTEIRKQSGAVERAFQKHENKETARKWRKALNEAGNLCGWESKNTANGDESKLIQIIVDDIFQKISSCDSSVDEKYVGMETRIEAVISSLELDSNDVHMIGIWGIGGGGKTTLARAVFDRISFLFDGTAFIGNVRENSKSFEGLNKLQQKVLSSIGRNICVGSVHEGTNLMKNMMHRKKVLIVLDDVDDIEQLEALAGMPDWFKWGSRVIITTRDKQVLLAHQVKFIIDVNLLSHEEAISLFSKYAFISGIPIGGYEELSKQVVQYAHGLPLTIKVLGSLLCGQNESEWIDTLERLKIIPLKATMEKLELSYNGLEEDCKEIFLDVACFLNGLEKDYAIKTLQSCGFFVEAGLKVLEHKSLITISEHKTLSKTVYVLEMHDHLVEMGKNIVRRVYPDEPRMHSRLWIRDEIIDILANNLGTKAIKCIRLDAQGLRLNFEILMKGLANMKELRFLQVYTEAVSEARNWNFDEVSLRLPNALRYLSWSNLPFSNSTKGFETKYLRGIHKYRGKIGQFWKDGGKKPLLNLRYISLHFSQLRSLDLSVAPYLETLLLHSCNELEEVDFQVTANLRKLRIHWCYRLEKFHMPAESPKLTYLYLSYLKLTTLYLGITPNLETLILEKCDDLVEVHFQVSPNLKELRILDCNRLCKLHMPALSPKLRSLDLNNLKFRNLHLGITPNLETLSLGNCTDIVELEIPTECPKLVALHIYNNEKLRAVDIGLTSNLEMLKVENCTDMVTLYMPAECPKLITLYLDNLKLRTLHLGITPNITWVSVKDCRDLVELWTVHIPAECPKLVSLNLRYCIQVAELPEEIGRLECLKELDITGTRISQLPESIFRVKGLLIVGSRWLLKSGGFTSVIETDDEVFCYI